MSTSIAHISDMHFGTEVPEVVEALSRMLRELAPDVVMLSGDITQRARKSQFKAAADFMASLAINTKLVVPGNHDIPLFNPFARLFYPYKNYKDAFGVRQRVWHDDTVGIICYDATHPTRHKMGKLTSKAVVKGIGDLKSTMPKNAIVIACAHQPLATSWEEDTGETLIDRLKTARLWANHGIDIVMSGHVHVPILITTHIAFPELPRHFILAGAGTAVSHRVRSGAPNSFNVINVTNEKGERFVEITQYDFDKDSAQFRVAKAIRFQKINQSWQIM